MHSYEYTCGAFILPEDGDTYLYSTIVQMNEYADHLASHSTDEWQHPSG